MATIIDKNEELEREVIILTRALELRDSPDLAEELLQLNAKLAEKESQIL